MKPQSNPCANCGQNAVCRNTGYSGLQCVCIDGFEGDGKKCSVKQSFTNFDYFRNLKLIGRALESYYID